MDRRDSGGEESGGVTRGQELKLKSPFDTTVVDNPSRDEYEEDSAEYDLSSPYFLSCFIVDSFYHSLEGPFLVRGVVGRVGFLPFGTDVQSLVSSPRVGVTPDHETVFPGRRILPLVS